MKLLEQYKNNENAIQNLKESSGCKYDALA